MRVPDEVQAEFNQMLDQYIEELTDAFAEHVKEYEAKHKEKAYNPNQSRDPAGSSTGGRWTSTGGSTSSSAGSSSSSSSTLSDIAAKADEVIAAVNSNLKYFGWGRLIDAPESLAKLWQIDFADYYDSLKSITSAAQDIVSENEIPKFDKTTLHNEVLRYGQAAVLVKLAANDKIPYSSLERVIDAKDLLMKSRVGQEFDLPLVAFTSVKLSDGEKAGEFYLGMGYAPDTQGLVRIENPTIGFDIGKVSHRDYVEEKEVLLTGRVRVRSIKKEMIRTGDGIKDEMTVITLTRAK